MKKNSLEARMKETEDLGEICSLSEQILKNPNVNHLDEFIEKVIDLSEENNELISVLMSFSTLLDQFESEDTITFLFNKAYNHFNNSKNFRYLNQILPVLTEWFSEAPDTSIDIDHILAKLMTIPYMKINSIFVKLVSTVIKRTPADNPKLKEFLLKIIYDTVPKQFANWAIKNVFEYFHDKPTITCIVKMLAFHLQGEPIPADLFDTICPQKVNTSANQKKGKTNTRSKSSSSRNQKRKKKLSDYSDDESEESSSSSDTEKNENKKRKKSEIEDNESLQGIINSQSQSTYETYIEEKRKNSIYLIQRAAQYEADFFRIGKKYGTIFKISIVNSKDNQEFEIGLHPFHTCRRIYLEVAKQLSIEKFDLYIPEKSPKEDKLLFYSRPISQIVEVNISKIKLKLVENTSNNSISETMVDPIFLTSYDDNQTTRALYDLLSSEGTESKGDINHDGLDEHDYLLSIILEILQLFELIGYDATSPLQKVLQKNYDHPLDFANNVRIFPSALLAYSQAYPQASMSSSDFTEVIKLAISRSYDNLSAVIIMNAITGIECRDFIFTPELIEEGLIQNKHKSLRHALLRHFNISTSHSSSMISPSMVNSYDEIVSLIPIVLEPIYREKSKEFLACLKKCNLSGEVFIPYYKKLNQYETVNNIDQTFISLLRLIPKNEETIKLTYERISVAPTVKNPQNPFVHCKKSRKAAFEFLTTDQVYPILLNHIALLPEVPSTSQKLSDDFTFKGRNGINNLGYTCYINTLMQSLNTASNVVNYILSLPTERLTPYISLLRDFMGQLRYSRNPSISIKPLVMATIPNFDPFKQEDTEEFLLTLFNKIIDELKEDANPLKEELEMILEIEYYQEGSDEKEGDTLIERNIFLPLQIRDSTNLFDSCQQYFKDETVNDYEVQSTQKKVKAIRKQKVAKWPNYLIIQLTRYYFNEETKTQTKLYHEFGFPMEFSTGMLESISTDEIKDHPIDYELSAILVHKGDIESGHYFAIVNGDNGDWYSCDDNDIKKFDIANIPNSSFGKINDTINDDQILTAYLLFYRRVDIEVFEPHLDPEFEEKINRFNETTWPSTFFYSHQFLDFAKNLTNHSYPNNDATEVALTCFFKIAVVNEPAARLWQKHIQQNFLTNPDQCMIFFNFIREKIGKTLCQIVNPQNFAYESLKSAIFVAFKQLQNTTEPLVTILTCLDFSVHKRTITLACELITLACLDLHVSWKNEENALLIMVKYITMEKGKDMNLLNKIKKPLTEAAEYLIKILSNVVRQKGVIEPIAIIFQNVVLDRLSSILKQSESFKKLTKFALSLQPSLISSIGETSPEVTDLLMNSIHKSFSDSTNLLSSSSDKNTPFSINTGFVGIVLEKLCFSSQKSVRQLICDTLCQVMDEPDPVVEQYINNRVFEPDLICPSEVEESTFLDMLASLLPIGLQKENLEYFNEFSKVLTKLAIAAPIATSLSFTEIIEAVPLILPKINYDKNRDLDDGINRFEGQFGGFEGELENNDYDDDDEEEIDDNDNSIGVDLLIRFMIVVKHLVAFNDQLRNQVNPKIIETFLNLECGREEALQFVALFQKEASGSPLFAACVSKALTQNFSDMSTKIINMVSKGISPGNFVVPDATMDFYNIKLATALFRSCEKQRDKLKHYILFILRHLKLVESWSLQPFAEAVQMIENHYQVKIEDLLQQ